MSSEIGLEDSGGKHQMENMLAHMLKARCALAGMSRSRLQHEKRFAMSRRKQEDGSNSVLSFMF